MNKVILLVFSATVLFFGCKSSSTTAVTDLTGDLTGDVTVYDENCAVLADMSGVKVEAEGTGFSTITDSKGRWTISGLPAGIYSIAFSKTDYDTTKNTSYQFVGGGTGYFGKTTLVLVPPYTPTLTQIRLTDSTVTSRHDTIRYIRLDTVKNQFDTIRDSYTTTSIVASAGIYGKFSTAFGTRNALQAIVYFSTDPNVSLENQSPVHFTKGIFTPSSQTDFLQKISSFELSSFGFKSGDKIYAIAYSADCYTSSYFDVKTRKNIPTGYGKTPSNVISFILP